MFEEISIDNCILGGTIFLLIFTLGCYLWFQNEMAYLQPQDTDTELEIQHLERPLDNKQVETSQIELTDTVQPEEKNSSDTTDNADMNPGVSHSDTPLEYIHRRIKEIILKKIEIV
ncbi:MAG: hypothetical protein OXI67_18930 [Candidatus Poribacteria bacterium]|nr:hypothetical protein [Candidatus Poribacteria bacterium]